MNPSTLDSLPPPLFRNCESVRRLRSGWRRVPRVRNRTPSSLLLTMGFRVVARDSRHWDRHLHPRFFEPEQECTLPRRSAVFHLGGSRSTSSLWTPVSRSGRSDRSGAQRRSSAPEPDGAAGNARTLSIDFLPERDDRTSANGPRRNWSASSRACWSQEGTCWLATRRA